MKNSGYLAYLIIAAIVGIIFFVAMYPLIDEPLHIRICDSTFLGLLFGGLSLLLKDIVRYGNYKSFPVIQRIVNYTALAILFVTATVVLEYYLLYLLFPENDLSLSVLPTMPVRIVIALLFFGFAILLYEYITQNVEEDTDEAEYPENTRHDIEQEQDDKEDNTIEEILEHIAVKNGQKIDIVLIPEIVYLQAEGDYVMIHSTKGKFLKEQTMKYFDTHLPCGKFVRIHRSGIVNIDYIASIESYEKQNQLLILKNNMKVKVSITGYKALKKALNL